MNNHFSIKEVVSYGFTQVGQNWRFFVPATAIIMAVVAGFMVLGALMNKTFLVQLNALQLTVQKQELEAKAITTDDLNQTNLSAQQKEAVEKLLTEKRKAIALFFATSLMTLVSQHWPVLLLTLLLGLLLLALILLGAMRLSFHFHDAGSQRYTDLASGYSVLPRLLGVVALLFCGIVIVTLGIVLVLLVFTYLYELITNVNVLKSLHGSHVETNMFTVFNSLLFVSAIVIVSPLLWYVAMRLRFVFYAVVDNHSMMNAFSHSWTITKGNVLRLFALQILVALFWIPKLFRVPLFLFPVELCMIRAYRVLEGK